MSRALTFGASLILCSFTATAGQVLPDAIQACRSEPDNARRLECYDREVAKFPTSQQRFGLSESQAVAAQRSPSSAAPQVGAAPKAEFLTAKVAAMKERPYAGFVVTLDNGQVWMQNEDESTRGIHVGDVVTIKPGLLGSFWLVGPSGWGTKAHRVK